MYVALSLCHEFHKKNPTSFFDCIAVDVVKSRLPGGFNVSVDPNLGSHPRAAQISLREVLKSLRTKTLHR